MKYRQLRFLAALLIGTIVGVQPAALTLRAEDTNTVELIKQLQKRIE